MRTTRLQWWLDGTPASFRGVSIGAGSAYIGELVGLLRSSGVKRIEIADDEGEWVKLTPEVREALAASQSDVPASRPSDEEDENPHG